MFRIGLEEAGLEHQQPYPCIGDGRTEKYFFLSLEIIFKTFFVQKRNLTLVITKIIHSSFIISSIFIDDWRAVGPIRQSGAAKNQALTT